MAPLTQSPSPGSRSPPPPHIQILSAIAQVFQDAQGSYLGHRKHIATLRNIHRTAATQQFEDSFNIAFCRMVSRILSIKKAEIVADRVVKLVAGFIGALQKEEEGLKKTQKTQKDGQDDKQDGKHEEDEQAEQDEEDDEDDDKEQDETPVSRFVNHFIHHLLRGIAAKNKNVRYRTLHILSLVVNSVGELDEDVYRTLLWGVQSRLVDKEPVVRVKAVLTLARFQDEDSGPESAVGRLLHVLEHDPLPEVRRAALLNIDKTPTTLNAVLQRVTDASATNRRLVFLRVMREIGDFRVLLRDMREHVLACGLKDRDPQVRLAAKNMFCDQWFTNCGRDIMELLERLRLTSSSIAAEAFALFLDSVPDVMNEIRFDADYWRKLSVETVFLAHQYLIHCTKKKMADAIETNYPETAEFAGLLNKYLKVRRTTLEENDESSITDIDFVVTQLLEIAGLLDYGDEIGRREMLQTLRLALYERLTDTQMLTALKVLRGILISEKDFCQMVSEIIGDIRDGDADIRLQDQSEESVQLTRDLQCLSLCQHMLELVHSPLRGNIAVTSLLDTVVNPAIRLQTPKVREKGIQCLGLCCLLDDVLAAEQLAVFGLCLTKADAELHSTCLKIIFDILAVHGPKVLDGEGNVDSLSMHKLLFRLLRRTDRPGVQAVTAEGLCKLYLNDIFADEELFETLLLAYFNPQNAENEELLQALSFCVPVYAFSKPAHQELIALIAADTFERSFGFYTELAREKKEGQMSSPTAIVQQLLFWCDSQSLVHATEEFKETNATHMQFLMDMLESMPNLEYSPLKIFWRALASNLLRFVILERSSLETLEKLYKKVKAVSEELPELLYPVDGSISNAFNKFIVNIEAAIEKAKEHAKVQEKLEDAQFEEALAGDGLDKLAESSEEEAGEGEAGDDLAIPETSLARIGLSFNDAEASGDEESKKNKLGDILGDLSDSEEHGNQISDLHKSSDQEEFASALDGASNEEVGGVEITAEDLANELASDANEELETNSDIKDGTEAKKPKSNKSPASSTVSFKKSSRGGKAKQNTHTRKSARTKKNINKHAAEVNADDSIMLVDTSIDYEEESSGFVDSDGDISMM